MGADSLSKVKPVSIKMRVIKKVKKRLGLAGRGVSGGNNVTNNLPPLLFHQVHGDNVRISRDGTVARRVESFCKGITFSARPVKIGEKIFVKFVEISNNWSGVIRFGYTSNDPATLSNSLPKYVCPDLTNKPGTWAKALPERLCEKNAILFYYVNSAGDVHFGVNGEEKGVFFEGVDTRSQLWSVIDIYGNSTAIEFLDARQQLNNYSRRQPLPSTEDISRHIIQPMANLSFQPALPPSVPVPVETPPVVEAALPPPRFQNTSAKFSPLPFHRVRGRNIRLSNDRCLASRTETEFCQGYVFTSRPIQLGEKIVIQVLSTEEMYMGALALGLTSCDPTTLTQADLPDDSDFLLDRPEYWVVSKDVAGGPQRGDELAFCITHSGEVQMSKNGSHPVTLMHVDQSLTLWAFLDIYGSTQRVRILGSTMPSHPPPPLAVQSSPPHSVQPSTSADRCCPVTVATAPGVGGGTVLVVNLPPPAQSGPHQHQHGHRSSDPRPGSLLSYSPTYIEPVSAASYSTLDSSPSMREWAESNITSPQGSECSVCYERSIDSVLYTCGHMCMCYGCAIQQWRGKGGGQCPLCRAIILDVIRTFKS